MKYQQFFLLLLVAGVVVYNCASQRSPSGGPVDKTPPQIVSVYPEPNSTNVTPDVKVSVEFSEGMDKQSLTGAIFLSPRQTEDINLRVKGKKLTIEFPDTLRKNRTYVVTIGSNTADLRRNRLTESFHLAFSTGEKIDQGKISGMVYGPSNIEGSIVGAYTIADSMEPDPAKQYAEYMTQVNAKGQYQFSYLAPGNYRLFAFQDKDGDLKYTHGVEAIGNATTDVLIDENQLTVDNIHFQIAVKDTILPGLASVFSSDRNHVEVTFNENINYDTTRQHFLIVNEQAKQDTLRLIDFFQNSIDGSRFHLKTIAQDSAVTYLLTVTDMFDEQGNPLDTALTSYQFKGMSIPDGMKPKLVQQSIKDRAIDIPLKPEIRLIFSEALMKIRPGGLERHFTLTDSNKTAVDGTFHWKNPADFTFTPATELASLMKYQIQIAVDSVFDEYGNSLADSVIDIQFITLNKDTLSALSGEVSDRLPDARGKIYLTATKTGKEGLKYETRLDGPGSYHFDALLPGIYLISGFRDADSNGVYSHGQVTPFTPAERFIFYPDSIKIRSRWPNEGNNIIFNEY